MGTAALAFAVGFGLRGWRLRWRQEEIRRSRNRAVYLSISEFSHNDKQRAHSHLLNHVPYGDLPREKVKLPKRDEERKR